MTVAMTGFAMNDVVSKSFHEFGIGQFLFMRGLIAIVLVAVAARLLGQLRPLSFAARPVLAIRVCGELVATWCFMQALFNIPLANLSAVMQALPLALTLFAALIWGEKVGWRRLTAIAVGFAGVLVIVRPGAENFDVYSLYALGSIAGCVVRDLATRRLKSDIPSLFVTLVTTVCVTTMGGLMSLGEAWKPVEPWHIGLMTAGAVFLLTGYFFTVSAMRVGEIAFVSPFRYFVLLFSILGAAIFHSEYPDAITLVGAAIIVATGIYTLYRERAVRRQTITPAPSET